MPLAANVLENKENLENLTDRRSSRQVGRRTVQINSPGRITGPLESVLDIRRRNKLPLSRRMWKERKKKEIELERETGNLQDGE